MPEARRLVARNPRSGEYDYVFRVPTDDELGQFIAGLRAAQRGWHAAGLAERTSVLRRWQKALRAAQSPITAALEADTGRRRLAAVELQSLLAGIDRWCDAAPALLATREQPSAALPDVLIEQSVDPYPV